MLHKLSGDILYKYCYLKTFLCWNRIYNFINNKYYFERGDATVKCTLNNN